MSRTINRSGYRDLSHQAAAILGLAAFTWGVVSGLSMLDAALRGVIVYFTGSVLAMGLRHALLNLTGEVEATAAPVIQAAPSTLAAVAAPKTTLKATPNFTPPLAPKLAPKAAPKVASRIETPRVAVKSGAKS